MPLGCSDIYFLKIVPVMGMSVVRACISDDGMCAYVTDACAIITAVRAPCRRCMCA